MHQAGVHGKREKKTKNRFLDPPGRTVGDNFQSLNPWIRSTIQHKIKFLNQKLN